MFREAKRMFTKDPMPVEERKNKLVLKFQNEKKTVRLWRV